jgi:C-lobe and N-lobe beta barrels of Tf-binding protein B
MPPPTPTPTPTSSGSPSIVTAATITQEFATKGASYTSPSGAYDGLTVSKPNLGDNAQLDVRYEAATNTYEIELPSSSSWQAIHQIATYPPPNEHKLYSSGDPDNVSVDDYHSNLQYSSLLGWSADTSSGFSAIGVATLPGGVPTTGSASYAGSLLGASSETAVDPWEAVTYPGPIGGTISLNFNFGSGSLSGEINPTLFLRETYTLPSLTFKDTVYSVGSTSFSGQFTTAIPGLNSFSGLFTGPHAEELIGNFAFPYKSPVNGTTQQAAGAFAARSH